MVQYLAIFAGDWFPGEVDILSGKTLASAGADTGSTGAVIIFE